MPAEILDLARLRDFELSLVVNEYTAGSGTLEEFLDNILILSSENLLGIVLADFEYI